MARRVTFSRNHTLSLSRTCTAVCRYCAFRTSLPHLHDPDAVDAELDAAVRRGAKELLILTGEGADGHPEVRRRLADLGHEDFVAYVVWVGERALERGLLPHTNLGAIGRDELARLRTVTASQGVMLESISERLMQTVHRGSPSKHPARRMATIDAAGELRIPFTSGILVGIGETEEERVASLEALAASHARHGHLQEVILQNAVPHERYRGREVADIADHAAREYWRTGIVPEKGAVPMPDWASAVTVEDLERLVARSRELMPDVAVQIPPNLADWWPRLVAAGATDLGGLSSNGDHISPEHPFPSPNHVRRRLAEDGAALSERLCVHASHLHEDWVDPAVMDTIVQRFWSFVPRRASGRGVAPFAFSTEQVGPAIERARHGGRLAEDALTALFAETRPEAIEAMRVAADELRAEVAGEEVSFVVNRNLNVSNVCTVGCAFCGFGQSRRSPDAYTHPDDDLRARVDDALAFGATELCVQSGIHPDWDLDEYVRILGLLHDHAPELHLHAYSPMEVSHMALTSGTPLPEVFARLRAAGLGSIPGTAAEVLDDGVRQRISPNKLPVARWVEVVEAAHAAGVPSTSTVMFGHVEEPWELARHMAVVRDLQERTGGITEFVPLRFIPFQTRLGRTHGIEEMSTAENLKHTAVFRLALGRSIEHVQASWVKLGLDGATEALRWGVDDLGGTLMEESISRMAGAGHGVRLTPEQLVGAAHSAGRPAVERTTLYGLRTRHPLPGAVAA